MQGGKFDRRAQAEAAGGVRDAGGPGIKSCKGTVANGKAINTRTPGKHTFKVTATSRDGGKATRTVTYTAVKKKASKGPVFTG